MTNSTLLVSCKSRRHTPLLRALRRWLQTSAVAGTLVGSAAWGANFNVDDQATFTTAIASAGDGDTITITDDFTMSSRVDPISTSVTVIGGGHTINANNSYRPFFVYSGTVAIQNLTVTNGLAKGGDGGSGAGAGGGGLGAGGAIFVNAGANVALTNVTFSNNQATGGTGGNLITANSNGGGGGLGGDGGDGPMSAVGGGGGGGGLFGSGGSVGLEGGGGGGGIFDGGDGADFAGGGGGGSTGPGMAGSGTIGGMGGAGGGADGGNDGSSGSSTIAFGAGGGGGGWNGAGGGAGPGGGGGGAGFSGQEGGTPGDFGGGGAGFNSAGADGGYGGGGGAGDSGGAGGFGGGGSSSYTLLAKSGGVGGGAGGTSENIGGGGGGAAFGGAIFVRQGGTLTIDGTAVSGGTVTAGAGGGGSAIAGTAAGSGLYLDQVTLNITGDMNSSVNDVIAGTGSVGVTGSGTITFSGVNTYSGGTTVSAGTLVGTTTSLQGAITNNANVTFDQATNGTYSGLMTGSGVLTKRGIGELTLSNASNSFSGGTMLDEGTLYLTQEDVLSTGLITVNGGTLRFGNGIQVDNDIQLKHGLELNQTDTDNAATYGGAITEVGGSFHLTKTGAGDLILDHSNNFSGNLLVQEGNVTLTAGGALRIANSVDLATGTSLEMDADTTIGGLTGTGTLLYDGVWASVSNTSNVTFDGTLDGGTNGKFFKKGNADLTLTGTITGSGALQVDGGRLIGTTTQFSTFAITNNAEVVFDQSGDGIYSGMISGNGDVTKSGTGNVAFSGTNTYFGSTTIAAGTLQVLSENSIPETTRLHLDNVAGANLDLHGNNVTIAGLTGGGTDGGDIQLNDANLTVNQDGGLGLTDAPDSSDPVIDPVESTYAGSISGNGGLIKQGAGKLTLTGSNSYTGGTTVSAGTLVGDTGSLQGDITNNDIVEFDQATDGTYSDVISGTGQVIKSGAAVLTVTGANTYSGGTTINAGTLQIGNGGTTGSIAGNITNNASLSLNRSDDLTFSNVISGTGSLIKSGAGALTVSGANTYTGGTTVSAGRLVGSTSSLQGDITNHGELEFSQSTTGTYSGMIDGNGDVTKSGTGDVAFSGTNTYTGSTTIAAGTLLVFSEDSIPETTRLHLDNIAGANLDLHGNNVTIAGLTGGGSEGGDIDLNGADLTVNQNGGVGLTDASTSPAAAPIPSTSNYAGSITGDGMLIKEGAGELTLTGTNFYTGGTTVSAGMLIGNTTSLQGNITNNAIVEFDQATDGTYSGIISGTGQVTKSGAGTLSVTGANTYSGNTNLNAGILSLETGSSLGTGSLIAGGGTLRLNRNEATLVNDIVLNNGLIVNHTQSNNQNLNGDISGTGDFTKTGTGIVILTGNNTFTGDVLIEQSSLYVLTNHSLASGNDVNISAGAGLVTQSADTVIGQLTGVGGLHSFGGSFTVGNANDFTYAGSIGGTGAFIKQGTGSMTFTGVLNHDGATTVSGGKLIGSTAAFNNHNIANNAVVEFSQTTDGTYSGVIGGTGSLTKSGTGAVTLSGLNTYTGGTTIDAGRLIGTTDTLTGDITNNSELEFAQTTDGTFSDVISGTGSLIKSEAGDLTLSGANTYSGGTTIEDGRLIVSTSSLPGNVTNNSVLEFGQATDGTFSGTISGSNGELVKSGIGALTLDGNNTFSGSIHIDAGTLRVGSNSAIPATTELFLSNTAGANFDLNGHDVTLSELDGGGLLGGNVQLGNNWLTIIDGGNTGNTYDGVISGTGGLTLQDTQLWLSGANTYTGGTIIAQNSLLVGTTTSIQGAMTNDGILAFFEEFNSTYDTAISGQGMLYVFAGEALTLTGANTYTGGTILVEGILRGNTTSLQGEITNESIVEFLQETDGTFAGDIGGEGALVKTGAGELTLSGANTYTGGTTISAGTLVGNVNSLPGDILNNSVLNFDQEVDALFGGVVSGSGSLIKTGDGTLTMSQIQTYTGDTSVLEGQLIATNANVDGNVNVVSTFILNQTQDGDWTGSLNGMGNVVKDGPGVLNLTGNNSNHMGSFTVQQGELKVNGQLGSSVTVQPGTGLSGNGSLGTTIVQGTIAPGNSIGTLTINGDYTQAAGSTYEVEVGDGGTSDLIDVTGTATLNGGTVAVDTGMTALKSGQTYTILTADGGVTGQFADVTDSFSFWDASLVYQPLSVQLMLNRNWDLALNALQTANQGSVLHNVIAVDRTSGMPMAVQDMITELHTLGSAAPSALDTLSGDLHATLPSVNVQLTTLHLGMVADRARRSGARQSLLASSLGNLSNMGSTGETASEPFVIRGQSQTHDVVSGWMGGYGLGGEVQSNGNARGLDYSAGGTVFGVDRSFDDQTIIGLAGSYTGVNTSAQLSGAEADMYYVTLYGRHSFDSFYMMALAGYGHQSYETNRSISVGPIAQVAEASYNADQFHSYLEIGQAYGQGCWIVTPLAGLQYVTTTREGFSESGTLGLTAGGDSVNSLRYSLGMRLERVAGQWNGWNVAPWMSAMWMAELQDGDRTLNASFNGVPTQLGSSVQGNDLGRHYGVFSTGLTVSRSECLQFFVGYDAQMSRWSTLHSGMGGVQLKW